MQPRTLAQADMSLSNTNLFKPLKVGKVELKTRLVLAPLSRYRNSAEFVATDSMLEYYTERATDNGGLLIAEATFPAPEFGLHPHGPMIHTNRQTQAWKKIVDAVHAKGSYFSCQLWNLGRHSKPAFLKEHGVQFWGAEASYDSTETKKEAEESGNLLKEISKDEIKWMINEYVAAAKRAIDVAGFDFIEVHAAHGFLIDQFFQKTWNKRTDEYGGSFENRTRFLVELLDALDEAVGSDRIGIKLTPYALYPQSDLVDDTTLNGVDEWQNLIDLFESRATKGARLAYLSVIEPRSSDGSHLSLDTTWVDKHWNGIVLRTGALIHNPDTLAKLVDNDHTLIGAGRYFIANPDLPAKLKNGWELTGYDRTTFYKANTNEGYLGWPRHGQAAVKDLGVPKAL